MEEEALSGTGGNLDIIEHIQDPFFAHTVLAATCGLCLRFFGENACSIADVLIIVVLLGYWSIEMSWIVKESVHEYPSDRVLLGLSRFPETVGCACLLVTSWLSTSQSTDAKVRLLGFATLAYSTAVYASGFFPESELLLSVVDIPIVSDYWYEFCCYGALPAVIMDISSRSALLVGGILTTMTSIRPLMFDVAELIPEDRLIWLRIVSVPLLCVAVGMYRPVAVVKGSYKKTTSKKDQ
ncbi:hypothetical protein SARC_06620 [Sphaeroforma arctica JP610]|uniref:Uncharacterized protein n=1 Tax=Sphaeroforma arctica JP610 TaxID=667725 RepID=A0A0L0FYK5_9EUKA|nr:hypothetical protein SARC_06620 [Sphaeroforma arctica JP610]KNC81043.1 hypothetical protein SARC_06620 [Sphaeroforma arctica JP610]|eukprot:XP_014154945.1 hypothetical protein SARC_06620 [Sphaeroforma arctica JP610]